MRWLSLVLSLLLLFVAADASAGGLPRQAAVPGGVAIAALGPSPSAPQAWFGERRVAVLRDGKNWVALIGLPLSLVPGEHELRVVYAAGRQASQRIVVRPKRYAVQRFTVSDKRKVEPLPEDELRIAREQQRIDEIKAHWRDEAQLDLAFQLPAKGRPSKDFGLRRIINGLARNPHAGIDLPLPEGTPIVAVGDALVLETGDYFFNGNSVYLDHGQGVVTLYCHMQHVDVRPGDHVARGQQIGLSGMTGRTTGPHLHWTVLMNGAAVDPRLFLGRTK